MTAVASLAELHLFLLPASRANSAMLWTRLALVAALLMFGLVRTVSAQIYAWRDARGTLVLSDRPLDPSAVTVSVPRAQSSVKTTRKARSRAGDFDHHIVEQAGVHSLRPDLVRAVIQVESAFNPRARSPKGAMGLMQLMPALADELGVQNPYDPAQNIKAGTAYLRQLLDRYDQNEELALAAYNAGPGAIDRHGLRVPPYQETRQYVRRIRDATTVTGLTGPAIYKQMVKVDGRVLPRYTNSRPESGTYEILSSR